jgi:hypothetical protein
MHISTGKKLDMEVGKEWKFCGVLDVSDGRNNVWGKFLRGALKVCWGKFRGFSKVLATL